MTTVSPLRGFKDMPYGHTTCGVTLLNLSRQKKRAAHHKVREQQTRRFIPLHPYEKIAQMIWVIQNINGVTHTRNLLAFRCLSLWPRTLQMAQLATVLASSGHTTSSVSIWGSPCSPSCNRRWKTFPCSAWLSHPLDYLSNLSFLLRGH